MPPLKYGCNPHQTSASYDFIDAKRPPFEVLNGAPGYINLLDALNAWRLVDELRECLKLPAAASFKHVSPAGTALGERLDERLLQSYGFEGAELTPLSCAYLRARGADPSSSFGDFIGLSDEVDEATADVLTKVVSDGVIAPAYAPRALEKLKGKKDGKFIVLKAARGVTLPEMESREVHGIVLRQSSNIRKINETDLSNIVTRKIELTPSARRDLLLGLITLKYTQSNSTGYALGGQMIGIGAGQQSRVDCTKLAGRKADVWHMRLHPKVLGLRFKPVIKRQERINWRLRYVEGDMTAEEENVFFDILSKRPEALTPAERIEWMAGLTGVSFVSDAFLPFRDNIDHAVRHGVKFIAQTGGSARDGEVTAAADGYGLVMAHTGVRLFHH